MCWMSRRVSVAINTHSQVVERRLACVALVKRLVAKDKAQFSDVCKQSGYVINSAYARFLQLSLRAVKPLASDMGRCHFVANCTRVTLKLAFGPVTISPICPLV